MPLTQQQRQLLKRRIFELAPQDGSSIGNIALIKACRLDPLLSGVPFDETDYWTQRDQLVAQRLLCKGQGRGGSVYRSPDCAAHLDALLSSGPIEPARSLEAWQPLPITQVAPPAAPTNLHLHVTPTNQDGPPQLHQVDYPTFRENWLTNVRSSANNTLDLGRRFAHKLLSQWLDIDPHGDDIVYCDGSGDGGIDVAYLERGHADDENSAGDTWFLVQSKYGSAFAGTRTLRDEGHKIIDTLDGRRNRLSSLAEGLLDRLLNFRRSASERDRMVVLFATEDPLTGDERNTMTDLRTVGRERLGAPFDVDAISIRTIYDRLAEQKHDHGLWVEMQSNLVPSGDDLLVGSTSLGQMYRFLRDYKAATLDLDKLYEKNVRRFLGARGKVNKAVQQTLRDHPERFGLFNNGITIVVENFERADDGRLRLLEPYVVNGCQTTRTIWEVCQQRLEAGGTGQDPQLDEWKQRIENGAVVTKIVRVGPEGEDLLQMITRYTNTQNAVREKDFVALTSDFRSWAKLMRDRYGVYLEIQRGGWESYRAWLKQHPSVTGIDAYANAFDLIKVYGAGWLNKAGMAFGKNGPFLPNGDVFRKITEREGDYPFSVDDLYAAYRLEQAADDYRFGRVAEKASRRQSRWLFYMMVIEILRDVLTRESQQRPDEAGITRAILALLRPQAAEAWHALLDAAIDAVDEYMLPGSEDSVFNEPAYLNTFNSDLNAFLKSEQLGSEGSTPRLRSLISASCRTLGRKSGDKHSPREMIGTACRGK